MHVQGFIHTEKVNSKSNRLNEGICSVFARGEGGGLGKVVARSMRIDPLLLKL